MADGDGVSKRYLAGQTSRAKAAIDAYVAQVTDQIDQHVADLNAKIAILMPIADAASAQLQSAATVHAGFDARISALEVAMTANNTADAQRDTQITSIKAQVTTTSGQVVALQSRVATDEAAVNVLTTRVQSAQDQVTALQAQDVVDEAAIAALQARATSDEALIAAIAAKTVTVHHVLVALPAIVLGASSDVAVTWPSAFKDATYTIDPPQVPAFLGKSTAAVKAGTQTATGVTITVKSTSLAITAGSVLDVLAYSYR